MECLPREYLPDDYHGPCAGTIDELIRKSILHGSQSHTPQCHSAQENKMRQCLALLLLSKHDLSRCKYIALLNLAAEVDKY